MINRSEGEPPRLYAVMLGGRAAGCNIELHDVVFVAGESFEAIVPLLRDHWFGDPSQVHVDAIAEIDEVEGFRVRLGRSAAPPGPRLWFLNIGGYTDGEFAEQHAYGFIAASGKAEAKQLAKTRLLPDCRERHKDDLFDIDDCISLDQVGGWHIHLEPDAQARSPRIQNGYIPLPRLPAGQQRGKAGDDHG